MSNDRCTFHLKIGNTYKFIENPTFCKDGTPNEHGWKCFVKAANPDLEKYLPFVIEEVAFKLCSTAAVPKRIIKTDTSKKKHKKLQISYAGWGEYDIPI